MKTELTIIAIVLLIFFVMCFAGCTLKFKATDLEFESEQTRVYKLESIYFSCSEKSARSINNAPILNPVSDRFFAKTP